MRKAAYFIGNKISLAWIASNRCCRKSRHVLKKNFLYIQGTLWLYTALVSALILCHAGILGERIASGLCLALIFRSEASNS